jgi:hypothetical protein
MFRFTIRDLLWLMVVVAILAAWWVDHRRLMHDLGPFYKTMPAGTDPFGSP